MPLVFAAAGIQFLHDYLMRPRYESFDAIELLLVVLAAAFNIELPIHDTPDCSQHAINPAELGLSSRQLLISGYGDTLQFGTIGNSLGLHLPFPVLNPLDFILQIGRALQVSYFRKANGVLPTSLHPWKKISRDRRLSAYNIINGMNLFRLGFCVLVVLVLVQAADKKSVKKVPAKEAAVQQPKKPAAEAEKPKVVEVAAAAKPKAVAVAAPVKEKAKEAAVPVAAAPKKVVSKGKNIDTPAAPKQA